MVVDLTLKNARVVTHRRILKAGIAIDNGKIFSVQKDPVLPKADNTIDCENNFVLPGLVDVHVHLREPGLTGKEDFFTGTQAAAAGGVTFVADMPNTKPPTTTINRFEEKKKLGERKAIVDFGLHVGITEKTEITDLDKKAIFFKIYMDKEPAVDEVFQSLKNVTSPVAIHAEDYFILKEKNLSGKSNISAYMAVHPVQAEEKAIKEAIKAAEKYKFNLHICHISTKKSLDLTKNISSITVEATPHHLFLSDENITELGGFVKVDPPLRDPKNRQELFQALQAGKIDIIATDHAPHLPNEKERKNIWRVPSGIPGLETTLPLLLTKVNHGNLTLPDIVRLCSTTPAEIAGIYPQKGMFKEGSDADLVIVDMGREKAISSKDFYSKAKYSPFNGWHVQGLPVMTILRGKTIMENGEIIGKKGIGKFMQKQVK